MLTLHFASARGPQEILWVEASRVTKIDQYRRIISELWSDIIKKAQRRQALKDS